MVTEAVALSAEDLIDILNGSDRLTVSSAGTHANFRNPPPEPTPRLTVRLSGIVRHDVDDQVVVLRANTPIAELQAELARHSQTIPYAPFYQDPGSGTVAGHLSMNLPHAYAASLGSWKEWLLGAKVVLANGLAAKSGSQVVKSVAGYDVHKFLIGARGALGILTELTLRTFPLKAMPAPDLHVHETAMPPSGLVQRVLPSTFPEHVRMAGEDLVATHPLASVLYRSWQAGQDLPDVGEGWQLGWGLSERNAAISDPAARRYFSEAKERFDPSGKLNPGEWGGF